MLVMTAKVDIKKIVIILAAVAVVIIGIILLFGGGEDSVTTAAPSLATNEGRVKFLTDFGWDVVVSPIETSQVKVPAKESDVFSRYNALQKSQGYDLTQFAGKKVMRYVYLIRNYPGATDPVYATLLVYKDQVIGGDVTDTSAKGVIQGFQMPQSSTTTPQTGSSTPTEATVPGAA